jgi:hypothetical protein
VIEKTHKVCLCCKEILSIECFYIYSSKYFSSYCKECNKLKKRELRKNPRVKELERQNRIRYLNKPGNREKHNLMSNERSRRYRLRKKLEKELNQ